MTRTTAYREFWGYSRDLQKMSIAFMFVIMLFCMLIGGHTAAAVAPCNIYAFNFYASGIIIISSFVIFWNPDIIVQIIALVINSVAHGANTYCQLTEGHSVLVFSTVGISLILFLGFIKVSITYERPNFRPAFYIFVGFITLPMYIYFLFDPLNQLVWTCICIISLIVDYMITCSHITYINDFCNAETCGIHSAIFFWNLCLLFKTISVMTGIMNF